MLVGIANNPRHPRKRCDFLGRTLGIASGDHDLARGVFAMDAANGRARILIGRSRHRARIQHYDFRLRGSVGSRQSILLELALYGGSIRLRSPATKVLHVKACHSSFSRYAEIPFAGR
jgi:hypothetical protein